ncbi:MAG: hypothetical protein J6V24_09195, partial [Clostridia bacterium]|nr:hypothetical protein [Clostridia bacterium]
AGHYGDAFASVVDLWGGQVEYGATCFLEVYRPSWNKIVGELGPLPFTQCGHTSLAHPWGAGVLQWLTEEMLGIKPVEPGFSRFVVKPHFEGRATRVSGHVATPHGRVEASFDLKSGRHSVVVPEGTVATVAIPKEGMRVKRFVLKVNGGKRAQPAPAREDGGFVCLDELPAGRQKIDTFIVNETYRERLNNFIRRQAAEGHQVYVVCPAVEESEKAADTDADEMADLPLVDAMPEESAPMKSAMQHADELAEALPELRVGFVHGKLKSSEKDRVMTEFAAGRLDVLVSTTVIEVGVNVPNATLMIVENAERFGLSQLHQLRGRVGRGTAKSYFILVSDSTKPEAQDRLRAVKSTTDGFEIADYDLELRGPGDFFNETGAIRQHGQMNFRLAAACRDPHVIERASYYARRTAEDDPGMTSPANAPAARRLASFTRRTEKTQN